MSDLLLQKTMTPPNILLPWLTRRHSLTQKLKQRAGEAELRVLNQFWRKPNRWEHGLLQPGIQQVLHRDIVMRAHGVFCWYARTILPDVTYQRDSVLFERLNQEDLGQLIYHHEAIERMSLKHYPIDQTSVEYQWLDESMHDQAALLWVRLSVFVLYKTHYFYLVEILLPGLMRYVR